MKKHTVLAYLTGLLLSSSLAAQSNTAPSPGLTTPMLTKFGVMRFSVSRAVMAAAAVLTERVRIMATVVVLPMHPAVEVAKQAATLDVLSGGRVTLGLGVGGFDLADHLDVLANTRLVVEFALEQVRKSGFRSFKLKSAADLERLSRSRWA